MAKFNFLFKHMFVIVFTFQYFKVYGRIHRLKIENDDRRQIDFTTFGLLKGGFISINVTNFKSSLPKPDYNNFGFTLSKTISSGMSNYFESVQNQCILKGDIKNDDSTSVVTFKLDLDKRSLNVERKGEDFKNLRITHVADKEFTSTSKKRKRRENDPDNEIIPATAPDEKMPTAAPDLKEKDDISSQSLTSSVVVKERNASSSELISINNSIPVIIDQNGVHFNFIVNVDYAEQQGLYSLIFHNCYNYKIMDGSSVTFTVYITEKNWDNYLSADEMPLPLLFLVLCGIYFVLGCLWLFIVKSSKEGVFKIHYLMLSLVYVKSIAICFHAINFYFIEKEGHHEEAFAILYYITHLMKGALLFITLVLVGAGWAFVKHILSKRDKKIFIIVIPLQIFANIAQIIIEETEEGQSQYTMWKEVFTLVDLLCCGAILFPVVWSIKHLQEASQTDGKAALNLAKLKIFRHFYIMIVCYIYFTRIIVYLIKITVPFNYGWIDELFKEIATFIFFFVSGFKFRPASNNPYLQITNESDEEVEMEEVVTPNGAFENITKVNIKSGKHSEADDHKNENSLEFD